MIESRKTANGMKCKALAYDDADEDYNAGHKSLIRPNSKK
jgi:hypothetical protein